MMRAIILSTTIALFLSGCITVYGPVKTDSLTNKDEVPSQGMEDSISSVVIGNRKSTELLNSAQIYVRQKNIPIRVFDDVVGIIAGAGNDPKLASLYIDCSMFPQPENMQESYRVILQIWDGDEGGHVLINVTGFAKLMAPDGNQKVKDVECKSTGIFERDLIEMLRK
jgi:hypothetical protein